MEQVDSNPTKSKFPDLLNGAIITLLITALVFAFSFAYNAGYNSYFGLPLFITNTTVLGLLEKTLLLSDVFAVMVLVTLFTVFIFKLMKHWITTFNQNRVASGKKEISIGLYIIYPTLLIVGGVYSIIKSSIILIIVNSVAFVLWIFALFFSLRVMKLEKRVNDATKTSKRLSNDPKLEESFTREVIQLSKDTIQLENFSKTLPMTKVWFLPTILFIFAALFAITFYFGQSSAKQQEVYYFSDQTHIVVGTFGDKAVLVSVNKDMIKNTYYVTGEYALSNFEGLILTIQNCGKIFSQYHESTKLETIETFS